MVTLSHEQILEVQTDGIDWEGKRLIVDGNWGPKTAWWYGILSLPAQRQLIIRKALEYYSSGIVVDDGNNRGTWPDRFLKPAGLIGLPWCVAMTSYILRNHAWFTEDQWPYHTSTLHLIEWARKEGRVVKEPLPGDLAAYMHDDTKGHTEINLACDANWIVDVGGNLSNKVLVGKRAKPGITFIRTVDTDDRLSCPPLVGMLNLDGTRTR